MKKLKKSNKKDLVMMTHYEHEKTIAKLDRLSAKITKKSGKYCSRANLIRNFLASKYLDMFFYDCLDSESK